ncbi:hypothetical protein [Clostridium sp. DL-VIII]|uniref:hypothetical protein n=1 Tax=Clostridium sp. DL-VIII TaxID=641107 RepID=UPI0002F96BBD|nr:hypothetical protein [Clostridium sp. DL-VIII]
MPNLKKEFGECLIYTFEDINAKIHIKKPHLPNMLPFRQTYEKQKFGNAVFNILKLL